MSLHKMLVLAALLLGMIVPISASAAPPAGEPGDPRVARNARRWSSLRGTIGPRGRPVRGPARRRRDLAGRPGERGETTLFASGLPSGSTCCRFGGVMDVGSSDQLPFAGSSASSDRPFQRGRRARRTRSGSTGWTGFRLDGHRGHRFTRACDNPPTGFPFVVPTGVQYALETYRGGFLVTDKHHNRIRVSLDGEVTQLIGFPGMSSRPVWPPPGTTIYLAGLVWSGMSRSTADRVLRARVVDHDRRGGGGSTRRGRGIGRGRTLFALSQGLFPCGGDPSVRRTPASHDTGALIRANGTGGFTTIADELDQPSSLEIIRNSAYVVTLCRCGRSTTSRGPPYG